MSSKHKLDLFDVLGKLSRKNCDFYDDLSEDEQKALHPLVVMRWLSGINSERQVVFLNELVNPLVFPLTNHKKLLVQLLSICTPGHVVRYKWNKAKTKKKSGQTAILGVVQEYFNYSSAHAADALPLLSDADILGYAENLGRQPDEIRAIKKELKAR